MARRKLTDVDHPDETLNDDFWLQFGNDPQPPMRLKILYVTFGEVEKSGPVSFNVASVCDRLGITYPMVNHYFGGRDGLLAEGAMMRYERYIASLWDAVEKAPRNPESRFRAWALAQVRATTEMGGWGPILNYPLAAREVTSEMNLKFQGVLNRLFELNLARLGVLIQDLRSGEVSDIAFTPESYPRLTMLRDPVLRVLAPSTAWGMFGLAVWFGGQHAPARNIPEVQDDLDELIEYHLALTIDTIRNWKEN
ncbi:MAG: hypothetical protein RL247_498 [Actinomycetota bacterium]|jgi:AcrR family transcriptional regulator